MSTAFGVFQEEHEHCNSAIATNDLWHGRLGHLNMKCISIMKEKKIARGFDAEDENEPDNEDLPQASDVFWKSNTDILLEHRRARLISN